MRIALLALLASGAFTLATGATAAACPLTYETFESAVPHIDLEHCPDAAMKESAFCRASMGAEQVHLFYFESEGDQCLIKVRSFDEDEYALKLKTN